VVLSARVPLVGVNVATNPLELKEADPPTATPPGAETVKVVVPFTEAELIGMLKVAVMGAFTATFARP
jgi:hypothetical protein